MSRLAAGAVLLASALSGCGMGIPADDFPGAPMMLLMGQVTSTGPLPAVEVGVVAQRGDPPSMAEMELVARTGVPLGTDGWYALLLWDPPPSETLRQLRAGEVWFTRGNAVAIPYELPDTQVAQAAAEEWPNFGTDVDHWLVYLESPAPPGSLTAWWLGEAFRGLKQGYHLVNVTSVDPDCMSQEELDACIADLVAVGVPDDGTEPGTAWAYCTAPYRLRAAPIGSYVDIRLGTYALPDPPQCSTP